MGTELYSSSFYGYLSSCVVDDTCTGWYEDALPSTHMANVKHTKVCCQIVSCKCCTIFVAHTRWQDKAVWSRHHHMLSVQVSSVLITQNAVPHLQHQRNFLDIITCYPVQAVIFRIPKENYWKLHSACGWYSHPELKSLWGSQVSAVGTWWVNSSPSFIMSLFQKTNEVHMKTMWKTE